MRVENHIHMARLIAADVARRSGARDMVAAVLLDLAHWTEYGCGRPGSVLELAPVDRLVLLARRLVLDGQGKPELAHVVCSLRDLSHILAARHHVIDHEVVPLELRAVPKPHGPLDALRRPRAGSRVWSYLWSNWSRLCDSGRKR